MMMQKYISKGDGHSEQYRIRLNKILFVRAQINAKHDSKLV